MPAKTGAYACPECGERAVNKPPRARQWRTNPHGPVEWSHVDGEPLCPIVCGDIGHGYEAAQPVKR